MPPYDTINLHPADHAFADLQTDTYDVICIGSGWAGRVISARVVKAGLSAVIVENELVGGDCPFWACIPSKVLLQSQVALDEANAVGGARERIASQATVDAEAVFKRRDAISSDWDDSKFLVPMVENSGVSIVRGLGKLVGEKRVEVKATDGGTNVLTANHAVVICTGSEPIIPDISGLAASKPWTPRNAASSSEAPNHLVIVGAGAVGCEMATAYASFGSKITLISSTPEILPQYDMEAGRLVRISLVSKGAQVYLSSNVTEVKRQSDSTVRVSLASGEIIEADEILVAAGRRPVTRGIGLEQFDIPTDGKPVPVDESLRVESVPAGWLYAGGDVNGRHPLTHGSKYHGRVIANAILAKANGSKIPAQPWDKTSATADSAALPQVVFTNPVVASVGLTRKGAEKAGLPIKVIIAPIATAASRVRDDNAHDGWAQWVVEEGSHKLLGATLVGDGAGELLHASTVAVVGEVPLDRLAHAIPSFPTLSEVYLNLLEAAGY
jgi:pyruvate/2-oxoglutarate dehydrogenase complex dihydrolipoamide dehydrogenase (E3) component